MERCSVSAKEYKAVLKDVLKFEIQALLDRLSEAGEESVVLTVSVDRLSCGHLGSRKGKGFVEASRLDEVQQKFLGFCSDDSHTYDWVSPTEDQPLTTLTQDGVAKKPGRVRKRKRTNPVKNNYSEHPDQSAAMYMEEIENLEAGNYAPLCEPTDLIKASTLDNNENNEPCDLSIKERNPINTFVNNIDCNMPKERELIIQEVTHADEFHADHVMKEAETESVSSDDPSQCWSATMPQERKGDEITYREDETPAEVHSVTPVKQEGVEITLNTSTELNNVSPTFRNALCLMPNPNKSSSSGSESGSSVCMNGDAPISMCQEATKLEVLEPSMVKVKIEEEPFHYSRPTSIPPPYHSESFINFQRPICSLNSLQFGRLVGNHNPFLSHLAANQLDLENIARYTGSDRLKPKKKRPRKDSKLKIKTDFTKIFSPELTEDGQKREPLFSYKDAGTICSECGQEFNKPESMIRHKIRKHLPRSFVCDVCQKGFSFKSELDKHFRIHSGEKPYTCNFCPKQFADGGNRMKHEIRCQKKLNQTF